MELKEIRPHYYQGWHPDGREIVIYRQLDGRTARAIIYGQTYLGNQQDQAY